MLLPLKAIVRKRARKDGKSIIYFQYCFSSTKRILLNTEIAVPLAYWNAERQFIAKSLPDECGDFKFLNDELARQKKIIDALVEQCRLLKVRIAE